MPLLTTPYAELDLIRQPEQANDPLQAFDAADEYLLAQLHDQAPDANCRVLVLNDSFGALAASLAGQLQVVSSGDSHLGHLALEKNLARNGLPFDSVPFVPASEHWQGPFDRVLVRVPKTLALLEEQLIRLQGQLAPGAQVIAGAMIDQAPAARGRRPDGEVHRPRTGFAGTEKGPFADSNGCRAAARQVPLPQLLPPRRAGT